MYIHTVCFVASIQHQIQLTNRRPPGSQEGRDFSALVDNTTHMQRAFVVVLYCIVIIFNDTIQYNNATPILQQYNNYIATNILSVI